MTEKLGTEQITKPEADFTRLAGLVQKVPELAAVQEDVIDAAKELSEEFALTPEFFNDDTRNLFLLLLSQRLAKARSTSEPSATRVQEEGFIRMAMPMLAFDKSANYETIKDRIDSESTDPEIIKSTYDQYTDQSLTDELNTAINNGLLSDVQQKLEITGNIQHFELRVLDVGDVYSVSGMEPARPDIEYSYPPGPEWEEYDREYEKYSSRVKTLTANSEEFTRSIGIQPDSVPLAWTATIDGKVYLCLPSPIAQKILRPDSFNPKVYDDEQKQRDKAVLEHEFVHTQRPLMLDGEPYFGIALEERRAEYFSGDKMGYQDVKGLLLDLEVVTGFSFKDWLEKNKLADRTDAYIELVNHMGAQAALEIIMTVPKPYVKESKPLQKLTSDYLGSPDELLNRLYTHAMEAGQESEVDARLEELVGGWIERGVDVGLITDTRPGYLGLSFMTEKYHEKYKKLLGETVQKN